MKTIAIIPARGGSKGIPRKNTMGFCGRPLLVWSVEQALAARQVDAVYVSSDHPDILELAQHHGASAVPRPDHLSGDEATSESALLHVLDQLRASGAEDPDLIVFLQATSPVREASDIDAAIDELRASDADSLFSAAVLPDLTLWRRTARGLEGVTYDPDHRGRRQDRAPLILENGSIYVFRPWVLRQRDTRLGGKISIFEMPQWKSFQIDSREEAELCELLYREKLLERG